MFAAVEFYSGDISFKGRVYDYFRSAQIISQRVEVPNALPFFTVKIKEHRGKIPFSSAQNVMGRLCDTVIYKKDIPIPASSPFKKFCGSELKKHLISGSALEYIKKLKADPSALHITVIDDNAQLIKKLESFVFLASTLQVVTDKKQEYLDLSQRLMKKYGACVVVSSSLSNAVKNSNYIISDKSDKIPIYFKGTVFTNEKRQFPFAKVLCGEGIVLPKKYRDLLPEGFCEEAFACALYEKCGVTELENLCFENLLLT